MTWLSFIFQDWKRNKGNGKARFVLFLFRWAQLVSRSYVSTVLFAVYLGFYHYYVEWVLGIELPRKLKAGKGLIIYHGQALVVNQGAIIGENCILRNGTSIGNKQLPDGTYSRCPRIGDNVDIGANVCIIGDICIGDNVKIGAGSVITKDVPPNCIVAGNPGRVIRNNEQEQA
jgi:putative colanic acid biosynthesis acetyltransferase WcaB